MSFNHRKLLDMQQKILPRPQAPSVGGMCRIDPNGNVTSTPEAVVDYSVQTFLISGDPNMSTPAGLDSNGCYPGYIMSPLYLALSGSLCSGAGITCRLRQPPANSGLLVFRSGGLVPAMMIGITNSSNNNDTGLPLLVPIVPNTKPPAPWIEFNATSGSLTSGSMSGAVISMQLGPGDFHIISGSITRWPADSLNPEQLGSGLVQIHNDLNLNVGFGKPGYAIRYDDNHYDLVASVGNCDSIAGVDLNTFPGWTNGLSSGTITSGMGGVTSGYIASGTIISGGIQVFGHNAAGCLSWFSVTMCSGSTMTSGM